jgi:hypothetical protein
VEATLGLCYSPSEDGWGTRLTRGETHSVVRAQLNERVDMRPAIPWLAGVARRAMAWTGCGKVADVSPPGNWPPWRSSPQTGGV